VRAHGSGIVAALVATDSFQLATSKYGGYAVRDSRERHLLLLTATPSDTISTTGRGAATARGSTVRGHRAIAGEGRRLRDVAGAAGHHRSRIAMFVWQTVITSSENSTIYPGRWDCNRTVSADGPAADSTIR
jgi:hypothetical protein